jgi:hypothetical protein
MAGATVVVAQVVAGTVIGALATVVVADVMAGPSSPRSRALPGPQLCEPGPELSTSTLFPPTPVQRGSLACSASSHGPLTSTVLVVLVVAAAGTADEAVLSLGAAIT